MLWFILSFSLNLSTFLSEKAILSSSVVPRLAGDNPSLCGSQKKRDRLSPWLADKRAILSLFVAPRGNEASPLSLDGCRRGGKSLIISLSVGLLVGKGRWSLWVDKLESEGKSKSFVSSSMHVLF